MKFTVKDIVFIALISVAMLVVSFLTIPIVIAMPIPAITSIVFAPFAGLLMAIAMLKVQKVGTATLVSLFVGVVLLFMSPVMFCFMAASGIVTDVIAWVWKRGYTDARMVIVSCGFYTLVLILFSVVFSLIFTTKINTASLLQQPLLLLAIAAICFVLGAAGAFIGSKVWREFSKAGITQ
jgi:hypothetical protein